MKNRFRLIYKTVWMSLVLVSFHLRAVLPEGFDYCLRVIPSLQIDLRYASDNNFTGQQLIGYKYPVCVMTQSALNQLFNVQMQLSEFGLGLKVFDAYRPQKAVDSFVAWSGLPDNDEIRKKYYPTLTRKELFEERFISKHSGHTRGSTVDLTLVDLSTGQELDGGTRFDFFGKESAPFYSELRPEQRANRALLRAVMMNHGFQPYHNEWWHFTLANEPFPNTYFDFDIE